MGKRLVIEWKHIGDDVRGTCERCSETGDAIREVLRDLGPYFTEKNVSPEFRETVLPGEEIAFSNTVTINGRPIEEYLGGSEVIHTPCQSCACLTGEDEAYCRAIVHGGNRYEAIPPDLIRRAFVAAVERDGPTCGCDCGCGEGGECP
ncbi:MAG: DUF2703 domain-containing protein [Methanolinea sp.]|nr:DUF2703 domain-containing protein [Methanolinea sp.]